MLSKVTVAGGWSVLVEAKLLCMRVGRLQNVFLVFGVLEWRGPLDATAPLSNWADDHGLWA